MRDAATLASRRYPRRRRRSAIRRSPPVFCSARARCGRSNRAAVRRHAAEIRTREECADASVGARPRETSMTLRFFGCPQNCRSPLHEEAGVEEVSDHCEKETNNGQLHNNNSHEKQSAAELAQEASKPLVNKICGESTANKEITKEGEEEKLRRLLPFEEAAEYLQHNPYIRRGYRGCLTTKLCVESIFWWTNETVNIWSHIFGWMLFFGLTLYDLCLLNIHAPFGDKLIVSLLLLCFQICMILSSVYHTFSCRSEKDYWCFLSFDLFGIALSMLSIYMSGVYYAFWCHKDLQRFYLITVLAIFIFAMILQIPRLNINSNIKLAVFVSWAIYGVLPTLHWTVAMGGFDNPIVKMLIPRVIGMYIINAVAFAFYMLKIPERFYPGCVDYVGSSHQWWHALVVLALYYWHNTGMLYVEYRMNHGCPSSAAL